MRRPINSMGSRSRRSRHTSCAARTHRGTDPNEPWLRKIRSGSTPNSARTSGAKGSGGWVNGAMETAQYPPFDAETAHLPVAICLANIPRTKTVGPPWPRPMHHATDRSNTRRSEMLLTTTNALHVRHRLAPTPIEADAPLVCTGPGGDFTTRYHAFGGGLVAVEGNTQTPSVCVSRQRVDWIERLLGIRRWRLLRRADDSAHAATRTNLSPAQAQPWRHGRWASDLALARNLTHVHESHAAADPHLPSHSRVAEHAWLFPHDAGNRQRARHQQGDRVRARGGARREGRAGATAEQGSLFGDCG